MYIQETHANPPSNWSKCSKSDTTQTRKFWSTFVPCIYFRGASYALLSCVSAHNIHSYVWSQAGIIAILVDPSMEESPPENILSIYFFHLCQFKTPPSGTTSYTNPKEGRQRLDLVTGTLTSILASTEDWGVVQSPLQYWLKGLKCFQLPFPLVLRDSKTSMLHTLMTLQNLSILENPSMLQNP